MPELLCDLCGCECENVRLIKFDDGRPSELIGQCSDCGVTVTQVAPQEGA